MDLETTQSNRDLLKFDNKYANPFATKLDKSLDHKSFKIASLLGEEEPEKPSRPNFCDVTKGSIFDRLN